MHPFSISQLDILVEWKTEEKDFFKLIFSLETGQWGYFFRIALADIVEHDWML